MVVELIGLLRQLKATVFALFENVHELFETMNHSRKFRNLKSIQYKLINRPKNN